MRKKQIDGQRSQLEENIVMLDSPDGKLLSKIISDTVVTPNKAAPNKAFYCTVVTPNKTTQKFSEKKRQIRQDF